MPANTSSPSHSSTRRHAHKFIIGTTVLEAECHHRLRELQDHAWQISPLTEALVGGIVLMAHTQMLEGGQPHTSTYRVNMGRHRHSTACCSAMHKSEHKLQNVATNAQQTMFKYSEPVVANQLTNVYTAINKVPGDAKRNPIGTDNCILIPCWAIWIQKRQGMTRNGTITIVKHS